MTIKVEQVNPQSFLGRIANALGVCVSIWHDRVAVSPMHELNYSRVAVTETHCHVVLWGVAAKNHAPSVIVIHGDEWKSVYQLTCKLLRVKAVPASETFLAALQTAPDALFERYMSCVVKTMGYSTIDGNEALRRLKEM